MSLSRIPLEQVFRTKPGSIDTSNSSTSTTTRSPSQSTKRTSYSSTSSSPPPSVDERRERSRYPSFSQTKPPALLQLQSQIQTSAPTQPRSQSQTRGLTTFNTVGGTSGFALSNYFANMATPPRGTRTAQMLEYERQADERSREQDAMNEERERMLEEQARMRAEQERISQEEYEMRQYYEAEALKHAEEVRIHQEGMYPYAQIRIRRKKLTKYTRSPKAPRSGPRARAAGAGP
jgi:hypothetical protein